MSQKVTILENGMCQKEQLQAAFIAGEDYNNECHCNNCSYCSDVKEGSGPPDFETWYQLIEPSKVDKPLGEVDKRVMYILGYGELIKQYPDCPKCVPFALLDEATAKRNYNQTLTRLNERGGLSPTEMIAVIAKRGVIMRQDVGMAIQSINTHLALYEKSLQPTKTVDVESVEQKADDYAHAKYNHLACENAIAYRGYIDGYTQSTEDIVKVMYGELAEQKAVLDEAINNNRTAPTIAKYRYVVNLLTQIINQIKK